MRGFRFLDHMSDVYIEAYGETLEQAFEEAGKAIFNVISKTDGVEPLQSAEIDANGFDMESLLYDWVEKLLLKFEIDRLVLSEFNVKQIAKEDESYRLKAYVKGEPYNPYKHFHGIHVKGATYWLMEIKQEDNRFYLRFVLDI